MIRMEEKEEAGSLFTACYDKVTALEGGIVFVSQKFDRKIKEKIQKTTSCTYFSCFHENYMQDVMCQVSLKSLSQGKLKVVHTASKLKVVLMTGHRCFRMMALRLKVVQNGKVKVVLGDACMVKVVSKSRLKVVQNDAVEIKGGTSSDKQRCFFSGSSSVPLS